MHKSTSYSFDAALIKFEGEFNSKAALSELIS